MSRSTDRILAAIDAGLQSSLDDAYGENDIRAYNYVPVPATATCVRCDTVLEDGDLCEPCRAFMLGETDVDPAARIYDFLRLAEPVEAPEWPVFQAPRGGIAYVIVDDLFQCSDPLADDPATEVPASGYARQGDNYGEVDVRTYRSLDEQAALFASRYSAHVEDRLVEAMRAPEPDTVDSVRRVADLVLGWYRRLRAQRVFEAMGGEVVNQHLVFPDSPIRPLDLGIVRESPDELRRNDYHVFMEEWVSVTEVGCPTVRAEDDVLARWRDLMMYGECWHIQTGPLLPPAD